MAAEFDPTDFEDSDFQSRPGVGHAVGTGGAGQRAPTRDEVDTRVVEAQQKLTELKRTQEELERQRAALEEVRRRQMEFQTGRQEMVHHLTRGLGLLEEAEFNARREAEQMAKTILDFRSALSKIESVQEESWTKDSFNVELTRAITAMETARMEWNRARLKYPVLSGAAAVESAQDENSAPLGDLEQRNFLALCRLGLAFNWPVAVVLLIALSVFLVLRLVH